MRGADLNKKPKEATFNDEDFVAVEANPQDEEFEVLQDTGNEPVKSEIPTVTESPTGELTPVISPARQKLLDTLKPKVREILSTEFFSEPKNRAKFYENLSNRYTPDEITQLSGEDILGRPSTQKYLDSFNPIDRAIVEQKIASGDEGVLNQFDTKVSGVTEALKGAGFPSANIAYKTLKTVPQGVQAGMEKIGSTPTVTKEEGFASGVLNVVAGTVETALSAATPVIPVLAAFHLGNTALAELTPKAEWLSPLSKGVQEYYKSEGKEPPKWAENLASLGDLGLWAGVTIKGKSFFDRAKRGEVKPEEMVEAIREIPIEDLPTDVEVQSVKFSKQAEELMQEISNENTPPEIKSIYENKLAEATKGFVETSEKVTTDQALNAAQAAERSVLESQKTKLESFEPTTATGKLAKEEAIKQIEETLNKSNEKETKKEETVLAKSDLATQAEGEKASSPVNEKITNLADNGKESPSTGSKGQGDQEISGSPEAGKAKISRTGTPKSRRKIRDPRYLKSISEEPATLREAALQYFVSGGEINRSAIQSLFGSATKKATGETKARFGILGNEKSPTIDGLAHKLWEQRPEGDERFTVQDYREAVESVLSEHNGRSTMVDELLKDQEKSDYMKEYEGYESDFIQEAENIFDNLKDEDIKKIADDLASQEYNDALVDSYLKKEEGKAEANAIAEENNFKNSTHLINSVNKNLELKGENKFTNVQDIPENIVKQVVENKKTETAPDIIEGTVKQSPAAEAPKPAEQDNAGGNALTKTEKAKAKLDEARLAFKKAGGLSSGGLESLPEFVKLVKAYVEYGLAKAADAYKQFKEDFPEHKATLEEFESGFNKVNEKFEREAGKKSLAGRVYEGTTPEAIKESVEKHGLQYDIESHPQAEQLAGNFVKEVGADNALAAVRNNEVEGGAAPFVWAQAIDAVHKQFLAEKNPEAKLKLAEKEASLIDEFDKKARSSGRFSSALQAVYQVSDLGYKLGTILNRAIEANKGEPVPEILKKRLSDLSEKLDDVNKRMAELEQKKDIDIEAAISVEVDKVIKGIYEKLPTERRKKADKAIATLEGIQKKLRDKVYDATIGVPVALIDAGITVIKQAIRVGVNIADAVELGIEHIKSKYGNDWAKESEFRKDILDEFKETDFKKEVTEEQKLEQYKNLVRKSKERYEKRLAEKDFTPKEKKEQTPLDKEAFELTVEKNKLKDEVDLEIEKLRLKNRPMAEKVQDGFVDVLNLPKSLMASADLSAPLRQGAVLSAKHPVLASKAAVEMFRQAFSEKASVDWLARLKATPEYAEMNKAGLYLAEPTAKLAAKEEAFISNIAHKIPIWGKVVKGSERAYTGYLNKLRADVFSQFRDALVNDGLKGDLLNKELESFADFINNASGRGNLGRFEQSTAVLNAGFFSPRYAISRFNLINPYTYVRMSPRARAEALKTVATYIGIGSTVLYLAQAGGAEVNLDPRSTDFGKIKVGTTRFDIWSGFQQWVRLIAQVYSGEKVNLKGQVKTLGEGYKEDDRLDIIGRFARAKASPAAGFTMDALAGKDIVGNPVTYKFNDLASFLNTQEGKLIAPLWIQDVSEAARDNGAGTAAIGAAAAFFGVGVQNYNNEIKNKEQLKEIFENRKKKTVKETPAEKKERKAFEKRKEALLKELAAKEGLEYVPPKK
jgi:hypothetical protein